MRTLSKIIGALLAVSACAPALREADYMCPNVKIPRSTAYVTQKAAYAEEVRIELIGFEGYCLNANTVSRRYAAIKPLFKIRRLREGYDTHVDFSYFTETIKGPPEFLGRKRHFASVDIPRDVTEKQFAGREVRVRIPTEGYNDFAILLGMDVSAAEYDANQKSFDIDYRYLSADELREYQTPVVPRVVEVDEAPAVQYIRLKPLPVRQLEKPKSDCGCDL